ncbi:MAG: peptidylprolyl isomerase [Anaeromyxobacteraceae bacterium]
MLRKTSVVLAVAATLACGKGAAPTKKGPVVAQGGGVVITADELKARLDEQSPMIRARFTTVERKKEFLDNMIRFELLAAAAEKNGLGNDPDVQLTMKKVMVSKYYQKFFQDAEAAKTVPDADVKKYYDEHPDEFHRPLRVHAAHILLKADAGSPDRARKADAAKKVLAKVQADEKKSPAAFTAIARESSEDAATKATGGDLSFKSQEELEKAYGKEFAEAVLKLKDNETASTVVESPQGFHLVHLYGRQVEMNRGFDEAKPQIASRLSAQHRTKDFDDYVKKLRAEANITVDDAALEKVPVTGAGSPSMAMPVPPAHPGAAAPTPAAASK